MSDVAALAAHVAIAVRRHRAMLRETGRPSPSWLHELEDFAAGLAKAGRNGTDPSAGFWSELASLHADPDARRFYSRTEVARMSGKSERTIRRLIADGALPETALGIPAVALDQLATT